MNTKKEDQEEFEFIDIKICCRLVERPRELDNTWNFGCIRIKLRYVTNYTN